MLRREKSEILRVTVDLIVCSQFIRNDGAGTNRGNVAVAAPVFVNVVVAPATLSTHFRRLLFFDVLAELIKARCGNEVALAIDMPGHWSNIVAFLVIETGTSGGLCVTA